MGVEHCVAVDKGSCRVADDGVAADCRKDALEIAEDDCSLFSVLGSRL